MAKYYRRPRRSYGRRRSPNQRVPMWVRNISRNLAHNATNGVGDCDLLPVGSIDAGVLPGTTIMRTYVEFQAMAGALSNAYGAIYFGLICLPRTGTPVTISPAVDYNSWDWMWWERRSIASLFKTSQPSPAENSIEWYLDVKSKRRLDGATDTLYFIYQWEGVTSTPVSTATVSSSVLLKK